MCWYGAASGACWKTIPQSKWWEKPATDRKRSSWRCGCAPHVVVMDFAMPNMNGAMATRKILAEAPEIAILILSMHSEALYVRNCLEAGAGATCSRMRWTWNWWPR